MSKARKAIEKPLRRKRSGVKAKTTISVSESLLEYVDWLAASRGVTRSEVVEELLADARRREEEELMVEGYRFFNEESVAFAGQADPAVWVAMKNGG